MNHITLWSLHEILIHSQKEQRIHSYSTGINLYPSPADSIVPIPG